MDEGVLVKVMPFLPLKFWAFATFTVVSITGLLCLAGALKALYYRKAVIRSTIAAGCKRACGLRSFRLRKRARPRQRDVLPVSEESASTASAH